MTRRSLLLLLSCLLAAVPLATPANPATDTPPEPLLVRIGMVTVGTDDIDGFAGVYADWLGYEIVERGRIAPALAASWGAPDTAGREYVLLRGQGSDDVMLRVVDVDVPAAHRSMTTTGWSVIEFLVEDPDAAYEQLLDSPFRHIGGPANLGGGTSSIRAVQFTGPASVALYLTADTAPAESARLPRATAFIGRPFIMVLATTDPDGTDAFYRDRFRLGGYPPRPVNVGVVARALGLPDDHLTPLGLAMAAEPGNAIEIDGYPAGTPSRPRAPGQLPPAVAITSFVVESLDEIDVEFIEAPAVLYEGRRAATFVGPAGELTELIELTGAGEEERP